GSILTAISIGRIHGRAPPERLLAIAFGASALALAIIAMASSLTPSRGPPLAWVALAAFIFGLGNRLISPLQKSLLTRRTPADLRGGVISVDRVIQQIAKSLAPALLGALLLLTHLEAVFWALCAAGMLGTLVLIHVAIRRAPSRAR